MIRIKLDKAYKLIWWPDQGQYFNQQSVHYMICLTIIGNSTSLKITGRCRSHWFRRFDPILGLHQWEKIMLQNWQAFLCTWMAGIGDKRWGGEKNDSNNDNKDTRIAVTIMSQACCNNYVVRLQLVSVGESRGCTLMVKGPHHGSLSGVLNRCARLPIHASGGSTKRSEPLLLLSN